MKAELALRFLLLRHLERLQDSAPQERFLEASRSLRVEADPRAYHLSWQRDGERHERSIPRGTYAFYVRGDRQAERRSAEEDLCNANDERARTLAAEILGVPAAGPAPPVRPAEPFRTLGMVGALATGLVLAAAGAGGPTALGVALLILVEYAPRGRLAASLGLLALAGWAEPAAVLLGALAYAGLQGLDPDPRQRRLRIALCGLAALLAASRLGPGSVAPLGAGAAGAAAAGLGLAALRSLWGSHARGLPLALPFLWIGLSLAGRPAAAWAGLGCSALGILAGAWAHRWLPVQRRPGPQAAGVGGVGTASMRQ